MCNRYIINFGRDKFSEDEIKDKSVIDVGSLNVNGTLKYDILRKKPAQYVGVDIRMGKDVDIICDACDLVRQFGEESFDIVVSTEMLEHVENWQLCIDNLKAICKKNGIKVLTDEEV